MPLICACTHARCGTLVRVSASGGSRYPRANGRGIRAKGHGVHERRVTVSTSEARFPQAKGHGIYERRANESTSEGSRCPRAKGHGVHERRVTVSVSEGRCTMYDVRLVLRPMFDVRCPWVNELDQMGGNNVRTPMYDVRLY